jgi:hypothetical protein
MAEETYANSIGHSGGDDVLSRAAEAISREGDLQGEVSSSLLWRRLRIFQVILHPIQVRTVEPWPLFSRSKLCTKVPSAGGGWAEAADCRPTATEKSSLHHGHEK